MEHYAYSDTSIEYPQKKMAESKDTDSSDGGYGGWWNSWYQTAKEKSAHALEFMKKDLTEFTNVMQQESSKAVSKTSETLKETLKTENTAAATDKLKHGISKFLDGITKALVVEAEDKYEPTIRPREDTANIFDRAKARLHAIQIDPGTYISEPSGTAKNFKEWQKDFDMEKHKGDISELLVSKVEVRALYTKLVPAEVSHADFWQRYFYKVHQLQQDEARKLALMQRAEMAGKKEDSVSWDEEWSSDEEDIKKEKGKHRVTNETVQVSSSETKTETQNIENTINTDDKSNKQINDKEIVTTVDNVISVNKVDTENDIISDEQTVEKSVRTEGSIVQNSESVEQVVHDNDSIKVQTCDKVLDTVKETVGNTMTSDKEHNQNVNISSGAIEPVEKQVETVSSKQENNFEKENKDGNKSKIADQGEKEDKNKDIDLKCKEKGDVVVVNPDRESPSSESSGNKDIVSLDEDWEQDFDVELTEEDLKAADEIAKKLNLSSADYTKIAAEVEGDDWENWN